MFKRNDQKYIKAATIGFLFWIAIQQRLRGDIDFIYPMHIQLQQTHDTCIDFKNVKYVSLVVSALNHCSMLEEILQVLSRHNWGTYKEFKT